jgi:hypothetical protein
VYGVMRDTSPYAYSPALGSASLIMAFCTFFFCIIVAFIFWVATMGDKYKTASGTGTGDLPQNIPAMAGGAPEERL